jgi:hypothetical protein
MGREMISILPDERRKVKFNKPATNGVDKEKDQQNDWSLWPVILKLTVRFLSKNPTNNGQL